MAGAYAVQCLQPGHGGREGKGRHVSTAPQGRGWTAPERRERGGKGGEEGEEGKGRVGGGGESQRAHGDQHKRLNTVLQSTVKRGPIQGS